MSLSNIEDGMAVRRQDLFWKPPEFMSRPERANPITARDPPWCEAANFVGARSIAW